jgi:hypothetical protein
MKLDYLVDLSVIRVKNSKWIQITKNLYLFMKFLIYKC